MNQVRKGFPTLPFAASLSLVTAVVAQVTVTDDVSDAKEPNCIKISTPACTLYYDKDGAGFTSIVDTDGNDWISYRPGDREAGEFRGIPNMGPCCHPGYSGHQTEITHESADRAAVTSSKNGWVTRWDFFPTHATLTIEEKPDDEYYWLYEGTPGGEVDDGDYMVLADGTRKPINTNEWRNDLSPEWIYFGDGAMNRVLFYVNHQDDNVEDQYWLMNSKMTVFGFGRTCHGACQGMSAAPARLSFGILEDTSFAAVEEMVNSVLEPTPNRPGTARGTRPGPVRLSRTRDGTRLILEGIESGRSAAIVDAYGRTISRRPVSEGRVEWRGRTRGGRAPHGMYLVAVGGRAIPFTW